MQRRSVVGLAIRLLWAVAAGTVCAQAPVSITTLNRGAEDDRMVLRLPETGTGTLLLRTSRDRYLDVELMDPTVELKDDEKRQRINDPPVTTLERIEWARGDDSDGKPTLRVTRTLENFEVLPSRGRAGFSMPGTVDTPADEPIRIILARLKGKAFGRKLSLQGRLLQEDHAFTYMDYVQMGMTSEPFFQVVQPIFPEDPLGVGGRWVVERSLQLDTFLTLPVKVTHTLTGIEKERRIITYEVAEAGPPSDFNFPIPVENGSATVGDCVLLGKGTIEVDPRLPIPWRMTMNCRLQINIQIQRAGTKGGYDMDIHADYNASVEEIGENASKDENVH